jgi:hypothetical protein
VDTLVHSPTLCHTVRYPGSSEIVLLFDAICNLEWFYESRVTALKSSVADPALNLFGRI